MEVSGEIRDLDPGNRRGERGDRDAWPRILSFGWHPLSIAMEAPAERCSGVQQSGSLADGGWHTGDGSRNPDVQEFVVGVVGRRRPVPIQRHLPCGTCVRVCVGLSVCERNGPHHN